MVSVTRPPVMALISGSSNSISASSTTLLNGGGAGIFIARVANSIPDTKGRSTPIPTASP